MFGGFVLPSGRLVEPDCGTESLKNSEVLLFYVPLPKGVNQQGCFLADCKIRNVAGER